MSAPRDLDAYLARVGYDGPTLAPGLPCLVALHRAHTTTVPFENLDIQCGRPVSLELERLWAKIVDGRRGGYCFEQNTLFQHVLCTIGFGVFAAEARVRRASPGIPPRTHMLLVATVEDRRWLCDVGFGGNGLIEPASLDGSLVVDPIGMYRVQAQGSLFVLQRRDRAETADAAGRAEAMAPWEDLYTFAAELRHPIDFEVANWYTSTHPESSFVKTLTVQRCTADARHVLRGRTYTLQRVDGTITRDVAFTELRPLLRDVFGLGVSDDDLSRVCGWS
jgi:N-hydroxyarylamine O-acetyltransferase